MVCSAYKGEGITEILESFITYAPKPADHPPYSAKNGKGEDIEVKCGDTSPSAFVFKTIADPFLGKISLVKVISGKLVHGQEIYNPKAEKAEKLGAMFFLRGKTQEECPEVACGDIAAVAKLQYTQTGDTFCDKSNIVIYPEVAFPQPTHYIAVEPKAKGDEEKVGTGLKRLMEEDPSFAMERNAETSQLLIGGQGDIQMNIILGKLKEKYGVDVATIPQKVA
jgi:elongation factor G